MTVPHRAVVLVGNPASPYSRGLRIARTLASMGYVVEIAAVAAEGLPAEESDGAIAIRRYAPSGPWAAFASGGSPAPAVRARRVGPVAKVTGVGRRWAAALRRWLFWPHTVRGWWATLERDLAPADLYHACGSLTISAALNARRRTAVGPAGVRAAVIYDAIDDVFESNNVVDMPAPIRAWHARRETGWARSADAVTTVNEPLADRLGKRWGRRPTPIENYPEPVTNHAVGTPGAPGPDLIRSELGVPASTRIALFQGRLGPRLGLDEAAEAILLVPETALVLLGFGRGYEREKARDSEPRLAGRHFTIPARHPDELLAWTASADAALIPLPPVSMNQRLSSPNKFWEALAAGTPVVVPAGLSYLADLVRADDLGVVARSDSATDLATALESVLDVSAATAATRRNRIAGLARERFSWPVAAARYRTVVERLEERDPILSA